MGNEKVETPTLAQVIQDAIESRICELHTATPGEIISYDSGTKLATVKPLLKRKYETGELVDLPNIQNVPVIHPRTADAIIHLPIKAGDGVLLVFAERSIDKWISRGGSVSPEDPRKHDLSDAVAIPGLFSKVGAIEIEEDTALTLKNKDMQIQLFDDGKVKIKNKDEELINILDELMDIMGKATTNTLFGPMRWNEHPLIIQLRVRLLKLKKE